ncbi:non-ribosomal peptide synthetase [Actinocrispum wychmicini]|uniref:Amino acid adenylation domain-containing protein n=1 Tax=Actinocrispum wychmicini TaxID=1213861 RepID=A0A4R2J8J4_9PSEU|nr:non-ribosomal peptide synthetase [Actinocrispum wychmicini]TCO54042.1 amino acid adenylation domain-containing protein [Actinocrispum wychmicini]
MNAPTSVGQLKIAAGRWPDQAAYWRGHLAGMGEPGCFPVDLPATPDNQTGGRHRVGESLDAELLVQLRRLGKGQSQSQHAIATAVLVALLNRYTGQGEVVVGQPTMAGRAEDNAELVLRCQVDRADSFRDLLLRLRDLVVAANDRADYPVRLLVAELGRPRLYDTAVVWHGLHEPRFAEQTEAVMLFVFTETEQGIGLSVDYDANLFTDATAQRVLGHYLALMRQLLADPGDPIDDATLVTAEDQRFIAQVNETVVAYDDRTRIERRLAARAKTTPDAVAVVADGVRLTYAQLDSWVNQLAWTLRSRGVSRDDIVAVVADRSPEMLVAIYAVLRAGGAYLPIDPGYPRDRVDYLLVDSKARLVLAQRRFLGELPITADILDLDDEDTYDSSTAPPPPPTGDSRDLACVIYTSGSTGNPKGVLVEHHSVINRIDWMQRAYPINQDDLILQKTPISFDVSVWELFWWAFQGAAVCLLPPEGHKDPDVIIDTVQRYGVTTMHFVPSMLSAFLGYVEETESAGRLAALRRVFASGEALGPHHVRQLQRLLNAELVNLYGPTEATVDVSHYSCRRPEGRRRIPIGTPIDNIRLYILDDRLRVQPVGVPGELCIAGAGVARGYLRRPQLTAEKFVRRPFDGEERVYRTGDLARLLPDGTFEYLGRLDHQVKIRGFRVELGEVEEGLRAHPAVSEAVVVARDGSAGKYLCGYVVAGGQVGEEEFRGHLAERLPEFMVPGRIVTLPELPLSPNGKLDRKALPEPAELAVACVAVEAVEAAVAACWRTVLNRPTVGREDDFFALGGDSILGIRLITALHQVGYAVSMNDLLAHPRLADLATVVRDVRSPAALALDPAISPQAGAAHYSKLGADQRVVDRGPLGGAPQGELESAIAACWRAVLNTAAVGRADDFFALGGDSILGIQLITALGEAGYVISIKDLFGYPRLADLATVAREIQPQNQPEGPVLDSWPASALQTGMIYHSGLDPDGTAYHDIFCYEFEVSRVDSAALLDAWRTLAARHVILRSRFDLERWDELRMVVEPDPAPSMGVLDCSAEADPRAVARDWVEREKRASIDPCAGPPYRVQFFVVGQDRVVLGFSFHHAILDGWSVATIIAEWTDRYSDLLAGKTATDRGAVDSVQHRHVELERRALADSDQADFWQQKLAGCEPLRLPRLVPGGSERVRTVAAAVRSLDETVAEAMRAAARDWAVPLKSVFLAAHLRVLGLIANSTDVLTGLVANGRPEVPGADQAVGMFLNSIPLRVQLTEAQTWRELAIACFRAEQAVQPYRWYPLAAIERQLGGGSLFEVIFNFTNFHVYQRKQVGAAARLRDGQYFEHTAIPLVVHVSRTFTGGWAYGFVYDVDRFSGEQIDRYLGYYLSCFQALTEHPTARWADTAVLASAELAELLPPVAAPAYFGETPDLAEAFRGMAVAHADRTAVSCENQRLSYRELDQRSDRLATHLVQRGVRPGDLVGIALDRGVDMVEAILATVKAGAAYVPIDPRSPRERIRYIVEDSAPALLIGTPEVCVDLPGQPCLVAVGDWPPDDGHGPATAHRLSAESPAYVIYTSGSTGKPKGVLVAHGNVQRLFAATAPWFGFTEDDTWSLFHSFAFDFSVWEMWGALLHGGHLVIVPFWTARSPKDTVDLLITERVTVLSLTPSAFGQMKRPLMDRCGPDDVPFRVVVFGGEALDFAGLADWFGHFGDERPAMVNMYGITETTVHVSYRPVRAADVRSAGSMIGQPIADLGVYLLDARLRPVPLGTPGEIAVTGAGVANGYLNRPDETARRFVEHDLHGDGCPVRLYLSGDLARRLPGGDIEYLGRTDDQVKVRGFRIEPAEVEFALSSHPAVDSSVVVAFTRRAGGKALVGYYVVVAGQSVSPVELREHLGGLLPAHMVPALLISLDRWPLTGNGKIDRGRLPHPERSGVSGSGHQLPRNDIEEVMAATWREVLGAAAVSIDDTYYELGGDSILAIRLVGALRQNGVAVSVPELMRHQTIRALADSLRGRPVGEVGQDRPTEPFSLLTAKDRARLPESTVDAYPATQLQLGMIFHTELDPRQATFHDVFSFRVNLAFDQAVLAKLLGGVLRRHEVLRTSFALVGYSTPMQLVHADAPPNLTVHDLSYVESALQEEILDAWFEAEKQTTFVFTAPTQMRFFAHVRGPACFNLSVSFHHAIIDGWSVSRLIAGLLGDYHQLIRGQEPAAEEPTALSYRDYVKLELAAQHDTRARDYWTAHLAGAARLTLPRIPDADVRRRWSETDLVVDERTYQRLAALAKDHRVPLKLLCLATHYRALSLITGERDVTTGVFGHGRPEHVDADRMVGLFLNILPRRQRVTGDWPELIAGIARTEHEHLAHRRFGYASIQRAVGGRRLVESCVNFVNFGAYRDRLGNEGKHIVGDVRWFEHADFALLVSFGVDMFADRLHVRFNAAAQVLGQRPLAAIAAVYREVLDDLLAGPEFAAGPLRTAWPLWDAAELSVLPTGIEPDRLRELLSEHYRESMGRAPADRAELMGFQPDSLAALRISHALRAQLGATVPLRALLGSQPMRGLLHLAEDDRAETTPSERD